MILIVTFVLLVKDRFISMLINSQCLSCAELRCKVMHHWNLAFLFYRRAHTLTVLFFLTGVLVYIAFFDNPLIGDSDFNAKRYLNESLFRFCTVDPVRNSEQIQWIWPIKIEYFSSGLIAVTLVFLLFGVTQTPDGPFKRPHPALWRFVFCCSIIYELGLIFMLFQVR